MTRATDAVLLGPGYFYTAPYTAGVPEAAPALTAATTLTTDPASLWVDAGYSEEGWNLILENEFSFWTPAELIDPIAASKDSQTVAFRGVLAQFSLETLKLTMGGGAITVDTAGVAGTSPEIRSYAPPATDGFDYISCLFRTKSSGTNVQTGEVNVRDIYIPQVLSILSADIPHNKGADNPSLVAVELRALKLEGSNTYDIIEQQTV